MPEQVEIREVGNGNPWQNGITYWDVMIKRPDGSVVSATWGKKGDQPHPGLEVEGEFFGRNDDGTLKFRKAQGQGGGGGFSQSRSSGGRTETDPARQWSITRQSAHKVAGALLSGQIPPDQLSPEWLEMNFKPAVEWLQNDSNPDNRPQPPPPTPTEKVLGENTGIEAEQPALTADLKDGDKEEDLPF